MNYLTILLTISMMISTTPFTIDFGTNEITTGWYSVNDGVMGGRSEGEIEYNETALVFSGATSLENNGGFSSMRSDYQKWNLDEYKGIRMKVKGTSDRKFSFTLAARKPWYMPSYKHDFKANDNEWTIIEMPISDFYQTRMGEPTGKDLEVSTVSTIEQMGIILYDKKAGKFTLEVDYIEFY